MGRLEVGLERSPVPEVLDALRTTEKFRSSVGLEVEVEETRTPERLEAEVAAVLFPG